MMAKQRFYMSQRTIRRIAAVTIFAAALGIVADICLLLYGYSNNPSVTFLAAIPAFILTTGYWLGICAIPIYMLGGAVAVACGLRASPLAAPYVATAVATSFAATAAHAQTASTVLACVAAGSTEIFSSCLLSGPGAPTILVAMLLLGVTAMSGMFALAVHSHPTSFPRFMAALNPLVLMLLLSAAALNFGPGSHPVLFAIPSIAAFIFAVLVHQALRCRPGKHDGRARGSP
ncbi:hypothetical protein [Lacisediminimonas profundi]|uniref:hypothetical protein n=1 Tax=Lacisediminimonas profundi TaxID=2603856 RepID=UPI00124BBE73|nr:hypothetical protein [Lacisediminimonas profundi]